MTGSVRVCVTGAAGQIAYSLIFEICRGGVFGEDTQVHLHLLDIAPMMDKLAGVVMEIEDCAFPLVGNVVATSDPSEGFRACDYCLLVGAMPRRDGMQRKDLLKANAGIFSAQGKAIKAHAKADVKVLVVGNPANTNALLALLSSQGLEGWQVSALTRLDMNRARATIARKVGVHVRQVQNIIIWGNHSGTQYPDVHHGVIEDYPEVGQTTSIVDAVNDAVWLREVFVKEVQSRGAAVIKARGLSSAASAAKAICDHIRDWAQGSPSGRYISMGVSSDGNPYGIREGLIYSMPVRCLGNGKVEVVAGLAISAYSREKMVITEEELVAEREAATPFLA